MNAELQPKKGRKYDQVIEGARAVFMREGFEGASVDEIARDAGVSKATLYSYFPDKQRLFLEVLKQGCTAQSEVEVLFEQPGLSVEEKLVVICKTLLTFFVSDFGQNMFRVCVAEAKRFPELGETFYDSGPKHWGEKIAGFLRSEQALAVLDIDDPLLAADQLAQLCRTDLMLKVMFGIESDPSEEELDRIVNEAVRTFLARYKRV
ncbi:TetR/AcrR family transcriptional regulator [Gymnodinialimonas ceratoperidinii]|uniref:TetR/AcrR family transcriptional regulator n=1 Tax=Gymnodinialimonas ceratoperidinii TaxID=2856823 RepID=A0A8F6TXV0_9RHOB|nr:TetR/AcrR family transcriptional regulator [Gymnodinialimonas ceratoperidinii]QXT39918.1 TetR/AcrR family transcriptional regulator [Gymnodinialimonas ceratoperidinii]